MRTAPPPPACSLATPPSDWSGRPTRLTAPDRMVVAHHVDLLILDDQDPDRLTAALGPHGDRRKALWPPLHHHDQLATGGDLARGHRRADLHRCDPRSAGSQRLPHRAGWAVTAKSLGSRAAQHCGMNSAGWSDAYGAAVGCCWNKRSDPSEYATIHCPPSPVRQNKEIHFFRILISTFSYPSPSPFLE